VVLVVVVARWSWGCLGEEEERKIVLSVCLSVCLGFIRRDDSVEKADHVLAREFARHDAVQCFDMYIGCQILQLSGMGISHTSRQLIALYKVANGKKGTSSRDGWAWRFSTGVEFFLYDEDYLAGLRKGRDGEGEGNASSVYLT